MKRCTQILAIAVGFLLAPASFADGSKTETLVPEVTVPGKELASTTLNAENIWQAVDDIALGAGPMHDSDYKQIASKVTEGLTTETEKARAIYRWMSEHIKYDVQLFKMSLEGQPLTGMTVENTLKRRRGVCTGYADLYSAMASHVGLTAKSVEGFAKGWGYKEGEVVTVKTPNHAWNAVLIDGRWKLLDVTWAAGSVTPDLRFVKRFKDAYFFPEPTDFIKKHEPSQAIWSLLDGDDFKAPVVRRPQAELLDLEVMAPTYGDITIASGEAFEIVLPKREDLRVAAWLSAPDSPSLRGEGTAYLPYETAEDGSLFFSKPLEEAGQYKFWIGAEPAETEGPLMIALEYNIEVAQSVAD